MNITKKVCIYILVGLITITGTFSSFYKGAYAFEYVGGALAFEEAIKWLLASVGIISAGGMTADYWEQHGDEFVDYCTEQNITDTEVANWQLKLCEGILDKSSACWQAFKEWASTLTGSSSGGGSVDFAFNIPSNSSVSDSIVEINNFFGLSTTIPDTGNFAKPLFNLALRKSGNSIECFSFYSSNNFDTIGDVVCASTSVQPVNTSGCYYLSFYYNPNRNIWAMTNGFLAYNSSIPFSSNYDSYFTNNIDTTNFSNSFHYIGFGDSVVDSDFISVQPDVTDLDIISSPLPDTDAQEVAIPMPGVSDSDNEVSASAYDDIIDAVNNGQIELDDAITQIQDILKIIVYEEETEKIFPKPDNEEDQEDLDDKINQNKDNMAFTLGGLENVFPFCIPWDIYAFMSLLRADPVPPKVELPFPNPLDPENPWIVEVDFADWDDGMRIVRLAEDFLFIIGLAVLTRSLIGAGGGDG